MLPLNSQPSLFLFLLGLLDKLLEGSVDGRSDVGDGLPELDGGDRALGNALGGELELLSKRLVLCFTARIVCGPLAL